MKLITEDWRVVSILALLLICSTLAYVFGVRG